MNTLFIVGLFIIVITIFASCYRWKKYNQKIAKQYFLPLFIGIVIFLWFYFTEYILYLNGNAFIVNYYLIRTAFALDVLFIMWIVSRDLFYKDKK